MLGIFVLKDRSEVIRCLIDGTGKRTGEKKVFRLPDLHARLTGQLFQQPAFRRNMRRDTNRAPCFRVCEQLQRIETSGRRNLGGVMNAAFAYKALERYDVFVVIEQAEEMNAILGNGFESAESQ